MKYPYTNNRFQCLASRNHVVAFLHQGGLAGQIEGALIDIVDDGAGHQIQQQQEGAQVSNRNGGCPEELRQHIQPVNGMRSLPEALARRTLLGKVPADVKELHKLLEPFAWNCTTAFMTKC